MLMYQGPHRTNIMAVTMSKGITSKRNDFESNEQPYTTVKYEDTFYGRYTALTPAVVKINRF